MSTYPPAGQVAGIIHSIPDDPPATNAAVATSVRFVRADHAHLRHVVVDLGPADSVVRRSLRLLGALPLPEGIDPSVPVAWTLWLLRGRLDDWRRWHAQDDGGDDLGLVFEQHLQGIATLVGLRDDEVSK